MSIYLKMTAVAIVASGAAATFAGEVPGALDSMEAVMQDINEPAVQAAAETAGETVADPESGECPTSKQDYTAFLSHTDDLRTFMQQSIQDTAFMAEAVRATVRSDAFKRQMADFESDVKFRVTMARTAIQSIRGHREQLAQHQAQHQAKAEGMDAYLYAEVDRALRLAEQALAADNRP